MRNDRERWRAVSSSGDRLPQHADYRILFHSSPQPMWVFDVETLRFLTVNDAAVARYGYSREEFLAMTITDIRPPEDVPALLANLADAGSGVAVSAGWRHRRKDGGIIQVEVSSCPLIFEGRRAELVIPTDVSERLRLEEQLRQAQKMEAVGRLAGGVAHDFNNVLTAVLGYAELALLKVADNDPLHQDLEEIRAAGERAAALTRQLLTFSRKQVVAAQVLDVGAVVNEASKLLARLIGEDVQLETRVEPGVARVKADRGQLEQVLMNLCVNAREAMPRGGHLSIEVANARLDEAFAHQHLDVVPGHYVLLAVSDTGVGMDEATRAHLFEPFFTTKDGGTGLGLATVYGIVKQSGGSIWVYSERGRGTSFKVYLPAVVGSPEAAPVRREPLLRQGNELVLLLEDDAVVRAIAERVLSSSGYRVLSASTSAEAEGYVRELGPAIALVVSDVILPQTSGREAVERLRAIQPDLRALFMSGYTDDAILRGGYLAPGVAFLQKPFTPHDLAAKVREVLDRGSGASAPLD
jgi:two-component system, cell cycle sensor histidine kinase and response regulator CckA